MRKIANRTINVTISGYPKIGKTTVARLLQRSLAQHGIRATVVNDDTAPVVQANFELNGRIAALASSDIPVVIMDNHAG